MILYKSRQSVRRTDGRIVTILISGNFVTQIDTNGFNAIKIKCLHTDTTQHNVISI